MTVRFTPVITLENVNMINSFVCVGSVVKLIHMLNTKGKTVRMVVIVRDQVHVSE